MIPGRYRYETTHYIGQGLWQDPLDKGALLLPWTMDCSVTLPDLPTMFQLTRSSRPVAKLKMVSGHHPTGGVLEVDLSPHGSIRSPGHGNIGDWCSWAGRGQIVLAANRNGGMLWLIASCHDDDDDLAARAMLSWRPINDRLLSATFQHSLGNSKS